MKYSYLIIVLTCSFFISCGSNEPEINEEVKVEKVDPEIPEPDTFNYDTLKGMYIGEFGGSDIRIILNYVSSKNAIGYNIHKGLQRNLNGKVTRSGNSIKLVLNEPGDNKFDGIFTIDFIDEDEHPKGIWEPNDKNLPKRNFRLEKLIVKEAKEGEINLLNFSDYFNYLSDTVGNYQFMDDGLCIFEYYPKTDYEERIEQLIKVNGSWSLNGQEVTIEWQPNDIFPEEPMVFKIIKSEYEELTLKSKDRELWNYYYGF